MPNTALRAFTHAERSARLGLRHRLATGTQAPDVLTAATSVVCLHATEPSTVYLSAFARVGSMSVDDLDRALYTDRTLVKHLAMRRTLFAFPRPALPYAQAGASRSVADGERRRIVKDVEAAGLYPDAERWLDDVAAQVLAVLADGRQASLAELRAAVPLLAGATVIGVGRSWGGNLSVAPRVLTMLSAAGHIVRGVNGGSWPVPRPRWAAMSSWLGGDLESVTADEGLTWLVAAWLRAFGPGTPLDIKWWLGSTLTAVRGALTTLDAVPVDLDGTVGYLLPDDLEPGPEVEPWTALLPPLDPTTMGWFERDWYLGPYKRQLFDSNGNAGPTAWCNGRIVGTWYQTAAGDVRLHLLEDVGSTATAALEANAARLTEFCAGERVLVRYPSPVSKSLPVE